MKAVTTKQNKKEQEIRMALVNITDEIIEFEEEYGKNISDQMIEYVIEKLRGQ